MHERDRAALLETLARLYPNPRSELNFCNDYQLIVCVVLSAQCTDKKVNAVTPELFRVYPSFDGLSRARLEDVENIIRPVNYYKTKARNLLALASKIVSEHASRLPKTMEHLISLPGVGRKTANVVLCEQGITPALPVDTHVWRVSKRLGLTAGSTPERAEEDLTAQFKPGDWRFLHHALVLHGRRVCKAQRPLCEACSLGSICPKLIQ